MISNACSASRPPTLEKSEEKTEEKTKEKTEEKIRIERSIKELMQLSEKARRLVTIPPLGISELTFFDDAAAYVAPNPRKIKRITNLYHLGRRLLEKKIFPRRNKHTSSFKPKLLAWIVLSGQWPVHMCWLIEVINMRNRLSERESELLISLEAFKER